MLKVETITHAKGRALILGPPLARFLFQGTAAAWLWLLPRVWIGWQWLTSGWAKFGDPNWMDGSGAALLGFWQRAVTVSPSPARPAIDSEWNRGLLQVLIDTGSAGWVSYLIALSEVAVGLALILGTFVGLAAAGGLAMHLAFLVAGTTSVGPGLVALQILLVLAWKNAGYVGLDRNLLPALGIPWSKPGFRAQDRPPRKRAATELAQ